MLKFIDSYENTAVLSIRTGGTIGHLVKPIIDPSKLKIVGFFVTDRFNKELLVLLIEDIREQLKKGIIIDDHEVLSDPKELVRLKKVFEHDFDPKGKLVVTKNNQKLGKVTNYAIDQESFYIQRIYFARPTWRGLGSELSFGRSQIIEITNHKFVIKEPAVKVMFGLKNFALKKLKGLTPQPQGAISASGSRK